MTSIKVAPLRDDLSFGARITGVNHDVLKDDAIRKQLNDVFEDRDCHKWQHTEMLIWDNWRMLHSVSGHAPEHGRRMQRTTIKGDYGLGCFENNGKGSTLLAMTV